MQDANNKMPLSCYVVVVVEGCVSSKAHDILDNLVTGNMANTSRKKGLKSKCWVNVSRSVLGSVEECFNLQFLMNNELNMPAIQSNNPLLIGPC